MKYIVLGGGTAGWIAALFLNYKNPSADITVIESSEIGILGAGEGTTPHFVSFLELMNIDLKKFVENTKATIKQGIKFTNWNGDGSYYFHPFKDEGVEFADLDSKISFLKISNSENLNDICFSDYCSKYNNVKFFKENGSWFYNGNFALHFDAKLTADYLKFVGLSRGIKLVDGIVTDFKFDQHKNITHVALKNGDLHDCKFIFDCTGFARKIIGNLYKSKWLDYQKSLPVNRALPFFIKNNSRNIPPYTEAIAMSSGWVWKIPVQGRFGCGYVFDSNYLTDEQAIEEIKKKFGEVEIPRSFSFKAGYYSTPWIKNCIALGLSSGFIEPLEATSIWVTLKSIEVLGSFEIDLINANDSARKLYNNKVSIINEEIKDFIQVHYITKRNDTPFWKEYSKKNKISNRIKALKNFKTVDEIENHIRCYFPLFQQWWVYAGVNVLNSKLFKQKLKSINELDIEKSLDNIKKDLISKSKTKSTNHYKFLIDDGVQINKQ